MELNMDNIDTSKHIIASYVDITISLGFVLMFISALPLAPVLCIAVIYSDVKVLRMTLLKSRRPMRVDAEDIGVVQSMMEFVAAASVTTNAGLFIFTQPLPYAYSLGTRLWIFIIFHIVCINIRQLAQYLIVDDPVVSDVSKRRQAFFEAKLVDQTPDVETENDDVVLTTDETHSDGLKGEVQMQKYPEDPLLFPITRDHTNFIH
jgi:hypothetical protein